MWLLPSQLTLVRLHGPCTHGHGAPGVVPPQVQDLPKSSQSCWGSGQHAARQEQAIAAIVLPCRVLPRTGPTFNYCLISAQKGSYFKVGPSCCRLRAPARAAAWPQDTTQGHPALSTAPCPVPRWDSMLTGNNYCNSRVAKSNTRSATRLLIPKHGLPTLLGIS